MWVQVIALQIVSLVFRTVLIESLRVRLRMVERVSRMEGFHHMFLAVFLFPWLTMKITSGWSAEGYKRAMSEP